MYFEHAGLNVPDPVAMSQWYVENCGLQIVVERDTSPYMHFLADATGRVIFELYANPMAPIPDYASQDPLVLHLAFAVDDMDEVQGAPARCRRRRDQRQHPTQRHASGHAPGTRGAWRSS